MAICCGPEFLAFESVDREAGYMLVLRMVVAHWRFDGSDSWTAVRRGQDGRGLRSGTGVVAGRLIAALY